VTAAVVCACAALASLPTIATMALIALHRPLSLPRLPVCRAVNRLSLRLVRPLPLATSLFAKNQVVSAWSHLSFVLPILTPRASRPRVILLLAASQLIDATRPTAMTVMRALKTRLTRVPQPFASMPSFLAILWTSATLLSVIQQQPRELKLAFKLPLTPQRFAMTSMLARTTSVTLRLEPQMAV